MEIRVKDCNLNTSEDGKLKVGGYVNVTNRESEMMFNKNRRKYFKETMQSGVFKRALENSNEDIPLLVQHDWNKKLASLSQGNLTLSEDNIGLKFEAEIEDRSIYEQVKNKEINSCSFGFKVITDSYIPVDELLEKRNVSEIELMEVSLVKNPAYIGSLVETREYEEEMEKRKKSNSDEENSKEEKSSKESEKSNGVDQKEEKSKEDKNEDSKEEKEEETECKRSIEVTIQSQDSDNDSNELNSDDSNDSPNISDDSTSESVTITVASQPVDLQQQLTTANVTDLVNQLIDAKMQDIAQAEAQEQQDNQTLSEIQSMNSQIENEAIQQCMADSLEVINLRLELLKLNQIKEGIQ